MPQPISRLEGEMLGRAEGCAKGRKLTSRMLMELPPYCAALISLTIFE